jgi:hypothetical protein
MLEEILSRNRFRGLWSNRVNEGLFTGAPYLMKNIVASIPLERTIDAIQARRFPRPGSTGTFLEFKAEFGPPDCNVINKSVLIMSSRTQIVSFSRSSVPNPEVRVLEGTTVIVVKRNIVWHSKPSNAATWLGI